MNAFGGIECSNDIEKDVECNIHLCPVQPIGEQGGSEFAVGGGSFMQGSMETTASSAWQQYQLNANYQVPAIFAGVPTEDAVVQVSGVRKLGVQETVPSCPLHLTSPMPEGNLLPLTIKESRGDTCTGLEGANVCHDDDGDGGERLGFLFKEPIIGMEEYFVEITRYVYSDEFDDTCTGVAGTMHGEVMRDGLLTPVGDCWGTEFADSIGYIYKPDSPAEKRPGTVPLVKVTVQTLCSSIRQFMYVYDQLEGTLLDGTKRIDATPEQYLEMGKERLVQSLGYKPEDVADMTEPDILAILTTPENQLGFGVDCKMEDICTGLAGQTPCHLPPGDAKEDLVGFIVGTDVTEDPADNWGNCAAALLCPIVYTEPVPAVLIEVAKKEVPEGENGVLKCAGDATNLPCGDDPDPMGGDHLGFLFEEVLLGIEMVPVTEGMLLKPLDDTKQKEVGFAFKTKQQGTTEINGVFLVTAGFKDSYQQCGFFSDNQKKWNFQMKIEFKPDKVEDASIKASFMVFSSGVYETRGIEDETKKFSFQVGTAKVSGSSSETEIKFHEEFAEAPMVISSVQTYNTGALVQTRHLVSPEKGKFLVALEGMDGIGSVKDEWIAWIAMEKGSAKIGSIEYKALETGNDVGDGGAEVGFEGEDFSASPSVFGSIATDHGSEAAHLSVVEGDLDNKKMKIGAMNDNFEGGHANEKASILVMKQASMQPSVMNGWLTRKVSYSFVTGNWGTCSHVCGEGKLTRDVHCVSSLHLTPVEDHYCYGDKPAVEQSCGFTCKYQMSDWSVCPGKGSDEKETRTVHCQKGNTDMLADEECAKVPELGAKPAEEQDCCNPKSAADFEGKQCGSTANGCTKVNVGDVEFGSCGDNWDCEENLCKCNEKPVALPVPHTPVVTDYLNAFGAAIDYACAPGSLLTGIGSVHSDPDEDRRWKYTCSTLAAPASVGAVCVTASFCGNKENDEAKCPAGYVLTGLSATVPSGEDRVYNFKCCELLAVVDEEGSTDMSEPQAEFDFTVTEGKVLTGVKSDFFSDKVDRKWQFHYASFKTKKHCETCTTGAITINITHSQFPATPSTSFGKDYDFSCPDGEVVQGVESLYEAPRKDSELKIKCAKVSGSGLAAGGDAAPLKCGAALEGGYTELSSSWYLECPLGETITKISSKFDQVTLDRQFKFTCSKFDDGSKLKLKGDARKFPAADEATWTYNAGADTGITGVESVYVAGGQRTFKFYGSTFFGPETCEEVWSKPQLQPQVAAPVGK
jgi:hypothetical protein